MAVNCLGMGVAGLSVHASTYTPPLLTSLTQEISTLPTILSDSSHAQALGGFGLTQTFFLAPRVAEHPRTEILHPPCCLFTHGQKRSYFSSHMTSIVVHSSQGRIVPHAQEFSWFSSCCSELRAMLFHPRLAVKGHSHFLAVSPTIGLMHRLFGTFLPCCELCSLISFRTVIFPRL